MYKASYSQGNEEEESQEFSLPGKLRNLKAIKGIATEITETGSKLFDLVSKENELREERNKAMIFLDNLNKNNGSQGANIEKSVKDMIKGQTESIEEMKRYISQLEREERSLEDKMRKKEIDLDRAEKRLKSLANVKPAYMEEFERFEKEMERVYNIYVEKFRNLDYLETQVDLYNKIEDEQFQENQSRLKNMQQKIKDEEWKILRGDKEIDESQLEAQIREEGLQSRGQSRSDGSRKGSRNIKRETKDNFYKGNGNKQKIHGKLNYNESDDEDVQVENENLVDESDTDNEFQIIKNQFQAMKYVFVNRKKGEQCSFTRKTIKSKLGRNQRSQE